MTEKEASSVLEALGSTLDWHQQTSNSWRGNGANGTYYCINQYGIGTFYVSQYVPYGSSAIRYVSLEKAKAACERKASTGRWGAGLVW